MEARPRRSPARAGKQRPADAPARVSEREHAADAGYTTRQVSEVLGLPTSQILAWARRGLVTALRGADGSYVFSFQDVALLRRVRELLAADVPPQRVRQALEAVREALPVGRPLSAVDMAAVGRRVLVRDEGSVWEPDTGQTELDFGASPDAGAAEPAALRGHGPLARPVERTPTADDLYDVALDLEAERPADAIAAYRGALGLDPGHVEAHLNLGRLLHEAGRLADAEGHYRAALASDGLNARAWYNLGVALEDRRRGAEARSAYERSVALDPGLAAAHFNLSRLLEGEGRDAEALAHLVRYKRIVEGTPPVDQVR